MKTKTMKRLLLVAACVWSLAASAQIEKGKWAVNAELNFETQKTSSGYEGQPMPVSKINSYSATVGIGNFISKSFFAGITFGYSHTKTTRDQFTYSQVITDKELAAGVQLKWYKKLGGRFYYNINGDFTYLDEKVNGRYVDSNTVPPTVDENTAKGHGFVARISPLQITFALSRKFLVETGFGYLQYSTMKSTAPPSSGTGPSYIGKVDDFHVNISPVVSSFTFTWVFGK